MEDIFSTKQRIKILEAVVFKTGNISVNNTANQLRLSKGLVSKYFDILTKRGILKKVNGKLRITDSSLVKGIKILFNLKNADTNIFGASVPRAPRRLPRQSGTCYLFVREPVCRVLIQATSIESHLKIPVAIR